MDGRYDRTVAVITKTARGRRVARELLTERVTRERTAQFADRLLAAARRIYVQTLRDLSREHGVRRRRIELAPGVERALRADARRTARQMLLSHNRDLRKWINDNAHLPDGLLVAQGTEFARRRWQTHTRYGAQTLAYTAHADATVAFYRDANVEPSFDFGGHGDAPPVCRICRALVETSPHTLATVTAVGIPHPQCRQRWHARGEIEIDPDVRPGQARGGLLDARPSLIERQGGRRQAEEWIRSLRR